MENRRFDDLTQALARIRSRRSLLSLLISKAIGGGAGSSGTRSHAASKTKKKRRKHSRATGTRAVVQTNGRKRVIAKGDVVVQGQRINSSARRTLEGGDIESVVCHIPETRYGLIGRGSGSAELRLEVTDDCDVVVSSIVDDVVPPSDFTAPSDSESDQGDNVGRVAAQAAEVRRQTGGWHEHKDVVGIVLTQSYAHIKYRDDGKEVSGASGQRAYCRNILDGWFGTSSLGDWSQTRRTIWIWKRCSFSWIGGSFKHRLDVDVYSWPSNDWEVFCTKGGDFVPGAKFHCGKAHWKI